jgi:hypothetical protein
MPSDKKQEHVSSKAYDLDVCAWKGCSLESQTLFKSSVGFCDKHWKILHETDNDLEANILRHIKEEAKDALHR